MIHAGGQRRLRWMQKKLDNPRYQVIYFFCDIATFMSAWIIKKNPNKQQQKNPNNNNLGTKIGNKMTFLNLKSAQESLDYILHFL